METFTKLFGSLLAFVYHCFDRIVIQGYLPLLTRHEHIIHFFRDVHGIYPITKHALAKRNEDYHRWALFHHQPEKTARPAAKIEAAYHRADDAIQKLIHLLAA